MGSLTPVKDGETEPSEILETRRREKKTKAKSLRERQLWLGRQLVHQLHLFFFSVICHVMRHGFE